MTSATINRDDLIWDWNNSELTSGQLARKYKTTKGVVVGIINRDPRSVPGRPLTPLQRLERENKALKAEVARLQMIEVARAQRERL